MANPHRGQVSLSFDGETYTLSFSVDAACSLEAEMDMSILDIFDRLQTRPRLGDVRTVLYHSLRDKHPDATKGLASKIIEGLGMVVAVERVAAAVQASVWLQNTAASQEDTGGNAPKSQRAA